jgi:monoamine oxidase
MLGVALAEVFDASGPDGAALAGFIALPPEQRPRFERSLPLLLQSQLAMLFGRDVRPLGAHWQDWAADDLCCSAFDRAEDGSGGHPGQSAASVGLLQAPLWGRPALAGRQGDGTPGQRLSGRRAAHGGPAARYSHLAEDGRHDICIPTT